MPSKVGRNYLNLCFTKIKRPLASQSSPITVHSPDRHRPVSSSSSSAAATTTAAFITNYNSLYDYTYDTTSTSKPFPAYSDADPDAYVPDAADFITAFSSHRFFFSSPGRSNSIIESTTSPSSSESRESRDSLIFNNSFAIPTYSPDPYADFRRSMQEMVEAREEMEVKKSSWEFLHDLLLCYLALNPKSTHEYILGAFADLASLIKPPLPPLPPPEAKEDDSGSREPESAADDCEISGQENDRDG